MDSHFQPGKGKIDNRDQAEYESDARAIQEALDAVERGDPGIPLEEVYAQMRVKYGIPDAER